MDTIFGNDFGRSRPHGYLDETDYSRAPDPETFEVFWHETARKKRIDFHSVYKDQSPKGE
ncbi:MAG: hypothetical protein U9R02_14780 [Thermodesulfobacteriota bacterium]|nr:hypothetical protein [Thermodesulfobacteriota bacterium]